MTEEFGPEKYGFIGTDNTANTAEIEKIEELANPKKSSKLLTVPVVQGAVSIPVNLPANCTANSAVAPGRLVMNSDAIEKIYKGDITKWSEILGESFGGNELTGVGCTPAADTITPVVRNDGSGTTHIFKRYFALIDPEGKFEAEDGGTYTWSELAEGTASKTAGKSLNQEWPTAAKVDRAATTTNTGVLKTIGEVPGAIGYADLAQARNPANGEFAKGGKEFWMELESSKKIKGEKIKRKYTDPSTDGLSTVTANSNCKKTVYVNGKKEFPPPTLESAWNEVGGDVTSKTYALCGLTYDFALSKYGSYSTHGATEGEAATVRDYLKYVTDKKGGQKDIENHDYAAMPKELLNEDKEGLEKIDF